MLQFELLYLQQRLNFHPEVYKQVSQRENIASNLLLDI